MPLLGRHKSSSASAAAAAGAVSSSAQQARPQPQVCDSPLFGLRKQLDLSTNHSHRDSAGTTAAAAATATASGSSELSSIPQQITRQQIHYAFSIMDTNQDGLIDLRDLSQMLANLGVPIDEAILSHIMSTVSKRGAAYANAFSQEIVREFYSLSRWLRKGDTELLSPTGFSLRVSEAEFLEWISQFIKINDSPEPPPTSRPQSPSTRGLVRLPLSGRSRVIRSSTASSSLAAAPTEVPRARRGSGSGLALMRSLSGSNPTGGGAPGSGPQTSRQSAGEATDSDARDDLKAAFCVFDLDGDGFITLDEVRAGLRLLGEESWTPGELSRLFSKCSPSSNTSTDLSGQRISIDDFVQLLL